MVAVVGVGVGDPDAAMWLNGLGVTFPAIADTTWTVTNQYWNASSSSYPQNAIVGRDEIVHDSFTGLHDEATLEGHLLNVIWMRDPVDIELVMDVSGSMNSPAPSDPGGDAKLLLMQRAANIVVNYLASNGQTNDRMGLVWFESDVRDYTAPGGAKLVPVQANEAILRAEINASTTGGCTAMGAGLQTAFNTLVSEGLQDRFAILCTDGMQNVDPMVTKVGSHYEIIDGGGYCAAHSSVAPVPGTNITTYNTRVHTIGVGITAIYATVLQEVADQTGGFYTGTDDPETDLDLLYMVDLCHCMAGGSPKISFHRVGIFRQEECYAEEHFFVNRTTRKITVILTWQQAQGCDLTFWLYGSDGRRLDLHRQMKCFGDHCLATVHLPANFGEKQWSHVGQWRLVIRGETTGGKADYHAFVICEDREVKFRLEIPRRVYEVGDYLPVRVLLQASGLPIVNLQDIRLETAYHRLSVSEAVSQFAYSTRDTDVCRESVASRLENKIAAMQVDAKFRDLLRPVRSLKSLASGDLKCSIEDKSAVVPIKLSRPGLHTFKIDTFCEVEGNGPVARTDVVSVMVGPGRPSKEKTVLRDLVIKDKDRSGLLAIITPKSEAGFLFGAGLADKIDVKVSGNKHDVKITDLLDGTYHVEITRPQQTKPESAVDRKKTKMSILFEGVLLWQTAL